MSTKVHGKKRQSDGRCPSDKKKQKKRRKKASGGFEKKHVRYPTGNKRKERGGVFDVDENEHHAILKLFRDVDWKEVINCSRLNVLPEDAPTVTRKGGVKKRYCHSFIFGPNMKDPNGDLSYFSNAYPALYSMLKALVRAYDPNHVYTNITINKNLLCKRHQDKGNEGKSLIVGFGCYKGGKLAVEPAGGGIANHFDCFRRFVTFNGKLQPHWTEPFDGERYTAVFYQSTMRSQSRKGQMASTIRPTNSLMKKIEELKKKHRRSGR